MVTGTKAETVIVVLKKTPLKLRNSVTEITLYVAANMGLIAKRCFSNAVKVRDRFRVQKLAVKALQEIRIIYRWQSIDMENGDIEKLKPQKPNKSL